MEVSIEHLSLLKDSLWAGFPGQKRSVSISPIYVERFRGQRTRVPTGFHKFWEFVCVISGEGRLTLDGGDYLSMVDNRVFLLPPGTLHAEYSEQKTEIIWVGCKGALFNGLPERGVMHVTYPELAGKFLELWKLSSRGYGNIGMELDGKCLEILGCFRRMSVEGEGQAYRDIVDKAVTHINEHFAEDIDIAELAARFNCSEGHFYRLFRKRIGMTPVSYISKIRIQNAVQWLKRSDLAISEIASLVGYHDQFYFSRVFRKVCGSSPKSFRGK